MMMKFVLKNRKRFAAVLAAALVAALPGMSSFSAITVLAAQNDSEENSSEKSNSSQTEFIEISSVDDFVKMADMCRNQEYSTGKVFALTADLDFSAKTDITVPYMDGTFDGKGHSITGVTLDDEMSDYGLFRYIGPDGGVVKLTVEASIISDDEQENIGIIVGNNEGLVSKCTSRGSINAQSNVGGIVGINGENGRVSDCVNEAEIDGKFRTGGVAGYNKGDISDCENRGRINTNSKVKKNDVNGDGDTVNISIPNAVTGLAADERANETGGVAGCSEGSIMYCKNSGVVGREDLGCITGGIVGRQTGSVTSCENSGMISGRKNIGGITGFVEPLSVTELDRDYVDEFTSELDDVSDALDTLDTAGDKLQDDLSGNVDNLRSKVKDLKNVVRDYVDAYENDIESSRSAIGSNVDELEDVIDQMDYDFRLKEINKAQKRLVKDITKMQELIQKLEAMSSGFTGDDYAALIQIIAAYKQELSSLIETVQRLTALLERIKARGASTSSVAGGVRNTILDIDDDTTEEEVDDDTDDEEVSDDDGDADDDITEPGDDGSGSGDDESGDGDNDSGDEDDSTDDESKGDDSSEASDGSDEGDSESDRPMAERPRAKSPESRVNTVSESMAEATQLLKLLQELDEYNADATKQVKKISKYLSKWPGEVDDVVDDLKAASDEMEDIYDATDNLFDKLHYRTDAFKGDVRWRTDGIGDTLEDTTDSLEADWDNVADSLDNLRSHVENVRTIFSDGYDELKDRIKDKNRYVDVSMDAKLERGDGRVIFCENSGEVIGNSQAGGIVGAIDIDSAEDTTIDLFEKYRHDDNEDEDDEEDEDEKSSLTKHVSALVYGCKNTADVTADAGYAGGIIGKAGYGAVTDCKSFCDVSAEDGKYAGGVAGYSNLAIVNSYVFGGVKGTAYVGGVAGRGEDIRSSFVCSYMDLDNPYVKAVGAVAGKAKGVVADNYFVDNGYGAVDDVTKSGAAVSLNYNDFIKTVEKLDEKDNLQTPKEFKAFTVKFIDGDEVVWSKEFKYGEELANSEYPILEPKDGEYVYWEYKDVSPVRRNVTVHSVRRVYVPSIGGGETKGKSDIVIAGMFYPDSALDVKHGTETEWQLLNAVKPSVAPDVHDVFTALYKYDISQVEPFNKSVDLRVVSGLIPANTIVVLDGEMKPVTGLVKCVKIGSYLSIKTDIPATGYIVVVEHVSKITVALIIAIAAGIIALLAAINVLFFRWRKRKKSKPTIEEAEEDEFAEDSLTEEEMADVDFDEPDEYGPEPAFDEDDDDFIDE